MHIQVEKAYDSKHLNVIMPINAYSYNSSIGSYKLVFTNTFFLDSTEEIPNKLKSIFDERPNIYNISGTIINITTGEAAKFNAYND